MYCDRETCKKLIKLGYGNPCDYVWCKEYYVRREAKKAFGELTGPEYLRMTKNGGGDINFDEMFRAEWEIRPFEKRTSEYCYAISVADAIEWLHIVGMRFKVDYFSDRMLRTYNATISLDDYPVVTHARGNTPKQLFKDIVIRCVELLEEKKSKGYKD